MDPIDSMTTCLICGAEDGLGGHGLRSHAQAAGDDRTRAHTPDATIDRVIHDALLHAGDEDDAELARTIRARLRSEGLLRHPRWEHQPTATWTAANLLTSDTHQRLTTLAYGGPTAAGIHPQVLADLARGVLDQLGDKQVPVPVLWCADDRCTRPDDGDHEVHDGLSFVTGTRKARP